MTNLKRVSLGEGLVTETSNYAGWVGYFTTLESWHSRGIGSWDDLLKYCWWELKVNGASLSPPRRVTSPEELVGSVILPYLTDVGGGNYSGSVAFKLSIEVDTEDTFSHIRICRNSLIASARGRNFYNSREPRSGMNGLFNTPAYYLNFWNETGQRFIEHYTGVVPGTNNDGVVWWPNNNASKNNWIKIGDSVNLPTSPFARAACWNPVGTAYINAPLPLGRWIAQEPFLWTEIGKARFLTMESIVDPYIYQASLLGPSAMVFPLVHEVDGYISFLVHAHSFDTFYTDYVNTAEWELALKVSYRQTKHSYYTTLTPIQSDSDGQGHTKTMFNLFDGGVNPKYKMAVKSSPDSNLYPTKLHVCRRNIHTGVHSPWMPLAVLKRRIPNTPLRLDGVFKQ